MIEVGINGRNCTDVYAAGSAIHNTLQYIFLVMMLAYIILFNSIVLVLTVYTRSLRSCCFSKQLLACYTGNILGGLSLVGNDLFYSKDGIQPIGCQLGQDRYFFMYLGISVNMLILVSNTYLRFKKVTGMKPKVNISTRGNLSTRDMMLKCLLPVCAICICVSLTASLLQSHFVKYQFILCVGISFIPLSVSIVWNMLLSKFLTSRQKNHESRERPEATEHLSRAKSIINCTIIAEVISLAMGTIVSLLILSFTEHEAAFVGMTWLQRAVYVFIFTYPGGIFLCYTPEARQKLKEIIGKCSWNNVKSWKNARSNIVVTYSSSVRDRSTGNTNI